MPHASSEREMHFAQHLTDQLKSNGAYVCFSHARRDQDKIFLASPLVESIPESEVLSQDMTTLESTWFKQKKLIPRVIDQPWPIQPNEKVKGGVSIMTHQAQCPYKAFAIHRLGAEEPEVAPQGISALSRGSLIHDALEKV